MKNFLSLAAMAIVAFAFSAFTTAGAGGPDLAIGEVKVQCNANGRFLVIKIQNNGDTKNTATNIRIRPTGNDDATQKCIQAAVKNVPQIMPGKEFNLRVPLKPAPNCDCKNVLKFSLFVDHNNNIAESDESNNQQDFELAGQKNN